LPRPTSISLVHRANHDSQHERPQQNVSDSRDNAKQHNAKQSQQNKSAHNSPASFDYFSCTTFLPNKANLRKID